MENRRSMLKELYKNYDYYRRLYNHYLVSQKVAKDTADWYHPCGTGTLRELKAEVGECREMLHYTSLKLKDIKREIKNTNRELDKIAEIDKKEIGKL